jgi:hypothetical protein
MSDTLAVGGNTYVSTPGGVATPAGAPGGSGPGANTPVASQVLLATGVAVVGAVGIAYLFRKGESAVPLHFDAASALFIFLSYQAINIPLTAICYKLHGHSAAQAYLLMH